MAFNLKNRHLLSLAHHSTEEIEFLVRLAARLKEAKYSGVERPMLEGRNIAL
ncbi:ornithine carbamoyltransferase subunit F, partial [Cutibacterium avidum]|nr:ornithine carbamoyltransferase subunit F [Cutibacterium avidum]